MPTELKRSVVRGMVWTTTEKVGTMLFQICVSLVLAWFLMPEDYALVGILAVFVSICSVFVDSGFSAALIRKQEAEQNDYTSVFIFNVVAALVMYAILMAITPMVADYYGLPQLRQVAPILFLVIPINSLSIIQSTILSRSLDFKRLTKYTLWANFIASGVAMIVALTGGGVWTLVAQRLTTPLVRAVLLWANGKWRPSGRPGMTPLKSMFGYSSRLLASDLANSVYANVSQLFIGKMYTSSQLGYYEQARKLKEMPVNSIVSTIQGVTFPALSQLQDDPKKLGSAGRQVVVVMNFLIFPAMIGLIAVAADMFGVLVPERWLPTVPYFRILCISGLFAPLSVVSYNILKVKSDGKIILRLEIVKKAIATAVLIITIPISVRAIVWGQVAIFFSDALINSLGANRFVPWKMRYRVREVLPDLAMSLVMWGAVHGVGALMAGITLIWVLVAKILTGIAVYLLQGWIFKPQGWCEIRTILRNRKIRVD